MLRNDNFNSHRSGLLPIVLNIYIWRYIYWYRSSLHCAVMLCVCVCRVTDEQITR